MLALIIMAKVCVLITQTEALIIIAIVRKLNPPIIVSLCIFLSCTCKDKNADKK